MATSLDRRSFIAGTAGLAAASALAPQALLAAEGPSVPNTTPTPAFFAAPEPITNIAEVFDYDVVVVGAGAAGVPAAISAFEAGAHVALIQKESTAVSQCNTSDSILLDES